jgi:hypothetical protein
MAQNIRESNGAVPSEQANGETTSHSHR